LAAAWTISGKPSKIRFEPYGDVDPSFSQEKGGTTTGNFTSDPKGEPGEDVTYTLKVFGANGQVSDSQQLTRKTPKPEIKSGIAFKSFKADQKKLAPDEKVTFTWEIENWSNQKVEMWIEPDPGDGPIDHTQSTATGGSGNATVLANLKGIKEDAK